MFTKTLTGLYTKSLLFYWVMTNSTSIKDEESFLKSPQTPSLSPLPQLIMTITPPPHVAPFHCGPSHYTLLHYTLPHCKLYTYCLLYTAHCTLFTVFSLLYTLHCTLCTVNCTKVSTLAHCTLYRGWHI